MTWWATRCGSTASARRQTARWRFLAAFLPPIISLVIIPRGNRPRENGSGVTPMETGLLIPGEFRSGGPGDVALTSFVPDEDGALWNLTPGGLRCIPVTKIDTNGVPEFDFTKATIWPVPGGFDAVRRVHYEPRTDMLFLGGNKGKDHNQHWKAMGPVLCAYDHWKKGGTLRWKVVLPYQAGTDGTSSNEPMSFDTAGDYIFVGYTLGLAADKLTQAYVKVFRISDGSFVGNLSSEKELGNAGLLDLVEPVRALRRANGEYVVTLEDDLKARLILFRWKP